jgi:hypothetical protein
MPAAEASGSGRLARRRRYRRLMFGAVLAGTLGFVLADAAGYPLVGVGLYWAGFLAFLGVWRGTETTLFDERDRALERRAIAVTFTLTALVMIALWPTLLVLGETNVYTAPPVFDGALLTVSAQAVVFGVVYLWLRYR